MNRAVTSGNSSNNSSAVRSFRSYPRQYSVRSLRLLHVDTASMRLLYTLQRLRTVSYHELLHAKDLIKKGAI